MLLSLCFILCSNSLICCWWSLFYNDTVFSIWKQHVNGAQQRQAPIQDFGGEGWCQIQQLDVWARRRLTCVLPLKIPTWPKTARWKKKKKKKKKIFKTPNTQKKKKKKNNLWKPPNLQKKKKKKMRTKRSMVELCSFLRSETMFCSSSICRSFCWSWCLRYDITSIVSLSDWWMRLCITSFSNRSFLAASLKGCEEKQKGKKTTYFSFWIIHEMSALLSDVTELCLLAQVIGWQKLPVLLFRLFWQSQSRLPQFRVGFRHRFHVFIPFGLFSTIFPVGRKAKCSKPFIGASSCSPFSNLRE